MRKIGHLAAIAAAALSLGVFAAAATADDLDHAYEANVDYFTGPGCADLISCAWDYPDYFAISFKWWVPNDYGYYHLPYAHGRSAKNRFNDRKLQLIRKDGTFDGTAIACLDPGENRPDPGEFGYVKVGVLGSRCNN